MSRIVKWIGKNVDALTGLVLAACVGILAWANVVGANQVNGAVLLILGVLATTLLRDRVRSGSVERDVRKALNQLKALDTKVSGTQQALDQASKMRLLHGEGIDEALAAARRDTDSWTFKGGTGTFIRAVTLPECVQRAREVGRALTIRLEILDPTNDDLCEQYAVYQRSVSPTVDATGEVWTAERVKKESFATILAACWHRQRYRLLTIEVGVSSTITTFRWELSSHYLIMTHFFTPALLVERSSVYYDRYVTELRTSFEQSRLLPIEQATNAVPLSDDPSVEEAQKLFVALNLTLPRSFDDDAVMGIISKGIRAKNLYA